MSLLEELRSACAIPTASREHGLRLSRYLGGPPIKYDKIWIEGTRDELDCGGFRVIVHRGEEVCTYSAGGWSEAVKEDGMYWPKEG